MEKTVAAVSTPKGAGGISVIRMSGESALEIADKIFKSNSGKSVSDMKGYTASYGSVYDNQHIVDNVVVLVYKAPHSYTGENVVEISCHGGMYVTRLILRLLIENGASPAEPGEFTKRAFLNGKMGLMEAESVMDIISANGKTAAAAASATLDGALRKRIVAVKDNLVDCAAHLSAWADYPEEDIPQISRANLKNIIVDSVKKLKKLIKECDTGKILREGIDTVIIGRPNVGKSTIMNMLSGCERSIVTDIPGTTRDIIEETVTVGDFVLRISDTAGIRSTDNIIEQIGVEKAKNRIKQCDLILMVFDNSDFLDDNDYQIIENIRDKNSIAVINKCDLETKIDIEYIKKSFKNFVLVSAKFGEGADALARELQKIFNTADFNPYEGVLSGERQRASAVSALNSLKEAKNAIDMGFTLDAVTVSLEFAISELLSLTGESVTEEVVNKVFSKFCVGK